MQVSLRDQWIALPLSVNCAKCLLRDLLVVARSIDWCANDRSIVRAEQSMDSANRSTARNIPTPCMLILLPQPSPWSPRITCTHPLYAHTPASTQSPVSPHHMLSHITAPFSMLITFCLISVEDQELLALECFRWYMPMERSY